MAGLTGTEVVTRDLALGLAARGWSVSVYAPALGPLAEEIRAAGITVTADLGAIVEPPDVIHGHHTLETVAALVKFPRARAVFVCHDRTSPYGIPPRLARVRRFVAVDENCLERVRDEWQIPQSQTSIILNAVDTARFPRRDPLPAKPQRGLIFSHHASLATHEPMVRDACARRGIAVDIVGMGSGTATSTPEHALGQYDLVFAKARCALEALATGAAVVLCDAAGLGPLVTMREFDRLRRWNFGARTLDRPLDVSFLLRQIDRYNPGDAAAVTDRIREDASLERALDQYERVYRDVMAEDVPADPNELRGLLEPLLVRAAELEHELAACQQPDRMRELFDTQIAAIRLTMEEAPQKLKAGARAFARVRLRNGTDVRLGAWRPYPLSWAYRWRKVGCDSFPVHVDERMPVTPPVEPGLEVSRAIPLAAPAEPGLYVLRITIVQELVQWLDAAPTPVAAEVTVEIT